MKIPASLRYSLLTFRLDLLWFPAAIWTLFIIVAWLIRGSFNSLDVSRGFLGFALPLVAGVLGAYAVLDDPALELRFSTPRPAWRWLLERLGMLVVVIAIDALSYQAFMAAIGADLSSLGNLAVRQLVWLVPSLGLISLGSLFAFLFAGSTTGAMAVGVLWIIQLLLRGWFAANPVARYFFVFMGVNNPGHPFLAVNFTSLTLTSAALLLASWMLLKIQERYI